ncbi:MAG TPA: outer membrane beta-barrel protein [Thermoanaerobaculia bacterium]|nr:outer membrane beta-barrel protein [Thermoanaerobaculia bacterium]
MISKTRVMIALGGLLVLSMPAFAQGGGYGGGYGGGNGGGGRYYDNIGDPELRLHIGSFRPDGKSDYWDSIRSDFNHSDPSDFENPSFGLDYILPLNERMGVMFSGSYFEGTSTSAYRNFADNHNHDIVHDTTLDIGSATVGLVFHLLPKGAAVQPYIGVGGGAYPWRLQERGDFIDFQSANNEIFRARLTSSGTAFGYYGLVGLDVPISRHVSIFAEGRWTRAKADLQDDFDGFGKLDLGGREIGAGLSWSL